MDEEERAQFDIWFNGLIACDTDEDFKERLEAQEVATWWAVDSFSISYVDVVRSWTVAAGEFILRGEI